MKSYRIGAVSKQLNISIDTLRYYEKIDLLKPIHRISDYLQWHSFFS